MSERHMEGYGFLKLSFPALSLNLLNFSCVPLSHLKPEITKRAHDNTSLQKQTASSSSPSPSRSSARHVQPTALSGPNTAATYWYNTTSGAIACRRIPSCSFFSKQSLEVAGFNFPGSSSTGRTFYVRDNRSGRRFLLDTGAQLTVIPPTATDLRCSNPGL
nr:unnamed protein product [Spirometra erinaceieuropaei]